MYLSNLINIYYNFFDILDLSERERERERAQDVYNKYIGKQLITIIFHFIYIELNTQNTHTLFESKSSFLLTIITITLYFLMII